jgi:nucleotidyltransferase/DNA polymerase involved in DNA repair
VSVMCCRVPDFVTNLTLRQQPELAGRPLALLGPDELVWAVSPEAHQSGVRMQMPARQARMRCPDAHLQAIDMNLCQAEQGALVGTLVDCGLPVESPAWGLAYVDLQAVAKTSQMVQPYCADLGRQVRQRLSDTLVPSIGWDTSKFTARAAATSATPGRMRLVDRSNEEHFLQPLSIALLPLAPQALRQLDWLGIHTLGQYARLPATAVWQRFGPEGKLAQKWAQGHDDRPVHPSVTESVPPISVTFDPPVGMQHIVLEAMLSALRVALSVLASHLEGCREIQMRLRFANDSVRTIGWAFTEPVSDERRIGATLSHQLKILNWPDELSQADLMLLGHGELVPRQLTLFDVDEDNSRLVQIAEQLSGRHGPIFFQARVDDRQHALPERRYLWTGLPKGCEA